MEGAPEARPPLKDAPEAYGGGLAQRLAFYQRAGGVATPVATVLFAFLMGGLVVLATGHNPFRTYDAMFAGTGLNWFFHFGNHHIDVPFTNTHMWFWWDTNTDNPAAYNLVQTLLTMTPLILTGLAVAFAFRCGMFNIGGQGQYLVGQVLALFVGAKVSGVGGAAHIFLGVTIAALGGAAWGGIAGILKATVGAHEVITTIMLNWIAIWTAHYLVESGPLHSAGESNPISQSVRESGKLPVFWGDPVLQGLHVGLFIGIGMLVVYAIVLNRTTLGFKVRVVGLNPEVARYGGIAVGRSYFYAMAISGGFAGIAGAADMLGWQFRLGTSDIHVSQIGFLGIAVALLGRNNPVGIFFSALMFAALSTGTSTRQLDPTVFNPELASNLTLIIQGLIVLFVGADLLILYVWQARRKLDPRRRAAPAAPVAEAGR
jgi:ABC-type uncharacterized transport system permease subunit